MAPRSYPNCPFSALLFYLNFILFYFPFLSLVRVFSHSANYDGLCIHPFPIPRHLQIMQRTANAESRTTYQNRDSCCDLWGPASLSPRRTGCKATARPDKAVASSISNIHASTTSLGLPPRVQVGLQESGIVVLPRGAKTDG